MKSILLVSALCAGLYFHSDAQVGINPVGSAPHSSSGLDVDFDDRGFLLPRLSTSERDNIGNPAEGLQIFNTTTKCLELYAYGTWQSYACACETPVITGTAPGSRCGTGTVTLTASASVGTLFWYDSLTGGTNLGTGTSFVTPSISTTTTYYVEAVNGDCMTATRSAVVASVNAVPSVAAITGTPTVNIAATTQLACATPGGVWSSSDEGLATVSGTGLVTGISAGSPTISYSVTSNGCTGSSTAVVTVNPAFTCGNTLSVSHSAGAVAPVSKSVNYGTVQSSISGASKCWITQNLGASNQASSVSDASEAAGGWFWQFNRKKGYKHDGATLTPSWTITSINEGSDWTAGEDPCALLLGTGWRMPTVSEWTTIESGWANYTPAFASVLKLHAAGELGDNNGTLYCRGTCGLYWTSSQSSATAAHAIDMGSSYSTMYSGNSKAYGFTVRCLKD